jgi:Mg2+ and Co2+ transporter CorA
MSQNTAKLLKELLESVEADIKTIETQITDDKPDTSEQILQLREIQIRYKDLASSLRTAIALYRSVTR